MEVINNSLLEINYALDTFYLLMTGALVMFMALGFAMLESGYVRSKNTAEILTKNVTLYAIACVMYMFVGYDVMYNSPTIGMIPEFFAGLIPDFNQAFQFMLSTSSSYDTTEQVMSGQGSTFSKGADFFFQVVFVATAMSVVSGAVAERMKLWAFLFFAIVMTGFIYPVQGYWSWGGGFLKQLGFSDFAGSGVVHFVGGIAALTGVLLLGPRKGKYGHNGQINAMPGANLPLATLGLMILWFGWFGFNGGSQLRISSVVDANAVAAIFVNTNMSAVGGLIAAMIISRLLFGKTDLTVVINGALAGLVAITAEPLTPSPAYATLIGAVGGVLVIFSILTLDKLKIDDPVGAISVHGVVGMWGLLAVPITHKAETISFINQAKGLGSIFLWVFITSFIVWFVLKLAIGIRISEEDEYEGADLAECGMEAYPEFVRK